MLWGLPPPSDPPRFSPRPGGAPSRRRALRVGSGPAVPGGRRRLAGCLGRCGLRPSGRLRVAVSAPAPGGRRAVEQVGSDVRAGAERGRGAGDGRGRRLASSPARTRAASPALRVSGPKPPGAPDPQTPVRPCTWPRARGTWTEAKQLGRRGEKSGAPGPGASGLGVEAQAPRRAVREDCFHLAPRSGRATLRSSLSPKLAVRA